MSHAYNWKRFWYPLGSDVKLTDYGFLSDPESDWGMISNPEAVSLSSLSNIQCLILLGEPGIGKSYSLLREYEDFELQAQVSGDLPIWIDLAGYSSEERLIRKLSDDPTFKNLFKTNNNIFIFLDSLDECTIPLKSVGSILVEELKDLPLDRLYLRIACRFSEWEDFFGDDLRKLWKKEIIKKYELAPLRRKDVIIAAEANAFESEQFLKQIIEKEIIPFAIKPVTLEFLINTYRMDGNFPQSQVDLYKKGCSLLCTEINAQRRKLSKDKLHSSDQRLMVAGRIATIMMFTNRSVIYKDIDWGKIDEKEITISELSGRTEITNGNHFSVDEDMIREALSTALFIEYDSQRIGWAHQTYSEFLAAWYVKNQSMSLGQVQSLIMHSDGKLIPQFYETTAWLAVMEEKVFSTIYESDPEILLRGDLQSLEEENRSRLVERLLELIKTKKLLESYGLHKLYRKLNHSNLANQLYPILIDKSQGKILRRVATDIAEACELEQLQEELCEIALDQNEALGIRVNAAYAISRIGEPKTKEKLLPLALGQAGDDPDDELKGCGLISVWPNHLSTKKMFEILTAPKRDNLIGVYKRFIYYELVQHLSLNDLPIAINWVAKIRAERNYFNVFEETTDAIMMKAWEHFENPDVVNAFARAVYVSSKRGKPIIRHNQKNKFSETIENDDGERRKLIKAIVPLMKEPEIDSSRLAFSGTRIALSKDVFWMIENLNATKSEKRQKIWAYLIDRVFEWDNAQHSNAIIITAQENRILKNVLGWKLNAVDLNSAEAEKMRESYRSINKYEKEPPLLKPTPSARIENCLLECEKGNYLYWWHLVQEMTLEPRSTHYGYVYDSHILSLPGWQNSNSATRKRITETGKELLLDGDPETKKWLGTKNFYKVAYAGFKALELLLSKDSQFVQNLPKSHWRKWAACIFAFPTNAKGETSSYYQLLKIAYSKAPREIIKALSILIDKENKDHNKCYIHQELEPFWDDHLAKALTLKVKDPSLSPDSILELLDSLLAHSVKSAINFAKSLLTFASSQNEKEFAKAVVAGQSLMRHTDDASWNLIWPIFKTNVEFGKQIITVISYHEHHETNVLWKLSETKLTELYVWLTKQFPPSEDLENRRSGAVTRGEMVERWRNSIPYHLKERGTKEAVQAIEKLMKKFPKDESLNWIYKDAQSTYRLRSWQPLKPAEVRELIFNPERRLIQNEEQLFEIVIEALHRYQAKILGRFSPAVDLWNIDRKKNVYSPKEEDDFSRHVARHLEDDLLENCILINREVETRKGQFTDIHVDLIINEQGFQNLPSKRLSVIVEVKGCWHNELWDAMETQLVNKYLKENQCQHGIYLVGWFECKYWNNCKKFKRSSLSIEEARHKLEEQANRFSKGDQKIKALVLDNGLP